MSRFLVIISVVLLLGPLCRTSDLNVGTTLFTKADVNKECWASESIALLTSRMILEDLLPSTTILVIDSDEFVCDLVEYFRLVLEVVRAEAFGKAKHITLTALTDLLGLIGYDSMESLLSLYEELKFFLRSNGQGWAKPLPQCEENFEIQRINLQNQLPLDSDPCEGLILSEGENTQKGPLGISIPLPFFDSVVKPCAVALPYASFPMHNLEANTSSYLIMKYFVKAFECLQVKNAPSESVVKFSSGLCSWIEKDVLPRLNDDKFYAAFGGVLRVRNTLKRLGVTQFSNEKELTADINFKLPPDSASECHENKSVSEGTGTTVARMEQIQQKEYSKVDMVLTAALITILIWFILGTVFICYRMKSAKEKSTSVESQGGSSSSDGTKFTCCPSRSKYNDSRGTSSGETDATFSDVDLFQPNGNKNASKRSPPHKGGRSTYGADFEEARSPSKLISQGGGPRGYTNPNKTLPSIAEMSEDGSHRTPKKAPGSRKNAIGSPMGKSTPMTGKHGQSKPEKFSKVYENVYGDETDDTVTTDDADSVCAADCQCGVDEQSAAYRDGFMDSNYNKERSKRGVSRRLSFDDDFQSVADDHSRTTKKESMELDDSKENYGDATAGPDATGSFYSVANTTESTDGCIT